jgi:hypothetical protein
MRLYPITLDFWKFGEIHLSDLIGAIGVYVIWDSRAKARCTYIGEGLILKRLADHAQRRDRSFSKLPSAAAAIACSRVTASELSVERDDNTTGVALAEVYEVP